MVIGVNLYYILQLAWYSPISNVFKDIVDIGWMSKTIYPEAKCTLFSRNLGVICWNLKKRYLFYLGWEPIPTQILIVMHQLEGETCTVNGKEYVNTNVLRKWRYRSDIVWNYKHTKLAIMFPFESIMNRTIKQTGSYGFCNKKFIEHILIYVKRVFSWTK